MATLNCSCGAYSSWTESHYDVKSSEITPGGPDYPNGGTIYYCPHCQKEWVVAKEPETCQHTSTTPKFDANSHWDECDNCHARLNESAHHLATQELKPGGSDYPYGAIVTYCEDMCGFKDVKENPAPTTDPTVELTTAPTEAPTTAPTDTPTEAPTVAPSPTPAPTSQDVVVTTPTPAPTPNNGEVVTTPEPTKKAKKKPDPKTCKHTKYRYKYTTVDGEVHDCVCTRCGKYLGQEKHTFKTVQGVNGSTYEKCTKCDYVHCDHRGTAVWRWDKNEHWAWCTRCMTVVGTGAHSLTPCTLMVHNRAYTNAKFCVCGFATVTVNGSEFVPDPNTGELTLLEQYKGDGNENESWLVDNRLSDQQLDELLGKAEPSPAPTEQNVAVESPAPQPTPQDVTVVEATQAPPKPAPTSEASPSPTPESTVAVECKHERRVYTAEAIKHPNAHWQECLDCGKLFEPEAHTYTEFTVKTPSTCTTDAVLERKCVCGHVDDVNNTPQRGDPAEYFAHHVYDGYQSNYQGHFQKCTRCGTETPLEAHDLSSLTVLREPTCLMFGQVSFDCGICGWHEEPEATDVAIERYPALAAYKALGHDFSSPPKKVSGPVNCTEEGQGEHAATCTRCGTIDYDHPTGHAWQQQTVSNGTCEDETDPVIIEGTCECGAKLKLTYTRHHNPVLDTSKDVEPTCTEPGKINGHRCLYCGIFYDYEFAEALGHDWYEDADSRVEPTCETTGSYRRWCTRCDLEETVTIPTLSESGHHEYVRVNLDTEPVTCGGNYRYIMRCKICDADDGNGIQVEEVADHDVQTVTKTGPTTTHNDPDGEIMEVKSIEITITCKRCGKTLGHEWRTLVTTPKGNVYKLLIGKNTIPVSLHGGTHVTGQMGKDGGVYYRNEVNKAVEAEIKRLEKECAEVK